MISTTAPQSPGLFFRIRDRSGITRGYLLASSFNEDNQIPSKLNDKILKASEKSQACYIEHFSSTWNKALRLATELESRDQFSAKKSIELNDLLAGQLIKKFYTAMKARSLYLSQSFDDQKMAQALNQRQTLDDKINYCNEFLLEQRKKEATLVEKELSETGIDGKLAPFLKKQPLELEKMETLLKQARWLKAQTSEADSFSVNLQHYITGFEQLKKNDLERSVHSALKIDQLLKRQGLNWIRKLVDDYLIDTIRLEKILFNQSPARDVDTRDFFIIGLNRVEKVKSVLESCYWRIESI